MGTYWRVKALSFDFRTDGEYLVLERFLRFQYRYLSFGCTGFHDFRSSFTTSANGRVMYP